MEYSLHKLGIQALNPMQEDMLAEARKNSNIVLLSPTGSGKTLAYLLPVIESMRPSSGLEVLVLVPGRELAIQTVEVARKLTSELPVQACYGGRAAMEEHRVLREVNPRIVVGTPGRILDHLTKQNISADTITTLVIDEFDKSLELGFREQMKQILDLLPNVDRRILLSATDSSEIPDFVGLDRVSRLNYLQDTDTDYSDRIEHLLVHSPEKDKLDCLSHVLCSLGQGRSIVFLNYREAVDRVFQYLKKQGFSVTAFHGAMEQKERERALFRFQSGSANVLVSTDLAARGLDIDDVENILHYHLPLNQETYIHRNGRAARWDRQGRSIIILGPEETVDRFTSADTLTEIPQPAESHVPQSAWETIYVGRGKKDKVNKVDIMGFLCKQGGLERDDIGMIKVLPQWSFAAVRRSSVKSLLPKIKGLKIKSQKTVFEVVRE